MKDNESILVVDDDLDFLEIIKRILGKKGYEVEGANSGAEALTRLRAKSYDLVLLDIRMPGMSGMELLENLKANGISLPVIIITGHGDVPLAVRALKLGAFDFVQKPFNAHDLLDRVHAAFQQVQENRQKNRKLDQLRSHFDALTGREREIMELVVAGNPSKVIGMKLGISSRTVDIHRSNIMRKLNVRTIAELVQNRLALRDD